MASEFPGSRQRSMVRILTSIEHPAPRPAETSTPFLLGLSRSAVLGRPLRGDLSSHYLVGGRLQVSAPPALPAARPPPRPRPRVSLCNGGTRGETRANAPASGGRGIRGGRPRCRRRRGGVVGLEEAIMPRPVSKAQARFFGMVAGGKIRVKGLSRKEAKTRLRGAKLKRLPARKRRR